MHDQKPMPIAVVGMSCRLPGGVLTPGEFYRMLCRKRSGWSPVPPDRFNAAAYHHPNPDKKGCLNSQGGYFVADDISMFDAAFFDMTKKEAESMDPAQRLLLECTYEALENAGFPKETVSGKNMGVFVGANYTEHRVGNLRDLDHIPSFDATGNQGAFLAGRLAYYFNLHGPALTIDTACSSSMHAVHLAVQSIRAGESEQAIVAASHLITQPDIWVSMGKLRIFSDDGKTYAFDDRAKSGYARGEGAGCLILKPLAQAHADNDHIYSVIVHTGISHNGRTVGIVAPSAGEQEQLIRRVFAEANIDPRDVGFFEAHGTGTKKGDPIEAEAIYNAVGRHFTPDAPLFIGSAKPNVGHLECASGIVSLIKVTLMLYYRFILPNTEFESANKAIPFQKWNMQVATEQEPWPANRKYACANNFGFSGSNSTCVLSPPPVVRGLEVGDSGSYSPLRLFVLSANDEAALRKSTQKLGIWLEQHAELYQTTMPRNLAYTLCQRRSHLPWRVAVVASMCSEVATALNSHDAVHTRAPSEPPRVAFVYTGQGAQWFAMGRELLRTHPVFYESIARADAALSAIGADFSILEELYRDRKSSRVGLAHISQPICSAVQLALTDLFAAFGVRPSAVTGHSSGEIAAAYAAGALTFESAMAAAYFRGRVIVELKEKHPHLRGAMMAVGAGAKELKPTLDVLNGEGGPQAVVACENSPSSTTLSGDEEAIDRMATMFQEKGVFNRKLFVDVAYHSPHMKLLAESYLESVRHIEAPKDVASSSVEFFSSLHGRKINLAELGPEYWVSNLTQAVLFSTSFQRLCSEHSPDILLEVGPHAALKGPIMQGLKKLGGAAASRITYLPTLVRGEDATRTCLETAGQLFLRGYPLTFFEINHHREEAEKPELVPSLYPYPWSRQEYWNESRLSEQHRLKPFARHDLLGTVADWSGDLEPTWRNIIRTEDLPWLKDYQVHSRMMFPLSCFLSMAIEAAAQNASLLGFEAERFEIRDLWVYEYLFLEDGHEYETVLTFRPSGTGNLFEISSYEASQGWIMHCAGTVTAEPSSGPVDPRFRCRTSPESHAESVLEAGSGSAMDPIHVPDASSWSGESDGGGGRFTPDTLDGSAPPSEGGPVYSWEVCYRHLSTMGMRYPPSFQCLTGLIWNGVKMVGKCRVGDNVSAMPLGYETAYILHPSVLDAMLHIPLMGVDANKEAGTDVAYLPSFIRHIVVRTPWRKQPGEPFWVTSTPISETAIDTAMVEIFPTIGMQTASISIGGLKYKPCITAVQETAAPRQLCYKLSWEQLSQSEPDDPVDGSDKDSPPAVVTIVTKTQAGAQAPLVAALGQQLEQQGTAPPRIRQLNSIGDWTGFFIVLADLEAPVLASITPDELEQVKGLLTKTKGLLWVTRGASLRPTAPDASMALGLVRTARSEQSAMAASLDLDPYSVLDTDRHARLVRHAFSQSLMSDSEEAEMEFAEEDGQLSVPRIVPDEKLNLVVFRSLGPSEPYEQDFVQPGRSLQLASGVSGYLSSDPYFQDVPYRPLAADEVEIKVAASVLSPDDASNVDPGIPIARSCSGIVTAVGPGASSVRVGDRVCALAEGRFGTHARARCSSVLAIPQNLDMACAACIPGPYAAAYYAFRRVVHLRPSDNVLIQLFGPEGFAAIAVAKSIGASTFALVDTQEEFEAAREAGVVEQHILDARSIYLYQQIRELTSGRGMSVVLAPSGNEGAKPWACLVDLGNYVEVRTSAGQCGGKIELGVNACLSSFNMMSLAASHPEEVGWAIHMVMQRMAFGRITLPKPGEVLSVSELSRGLQRVRDGAVRPVVVAASRGEKVKVVHPVAKDVFDPYGTHLIIGGTGGLGRSMAKYMVQHGARNIVLCSRNGGGAAFLDELKDGIECFDAHIMVVKCDASDERHVRKLVEDCGRFLPPICGVIHAPMVLRDVLLEGMSHDDFTQVIEPKVRGAWNLHNVLYEKGVRLGYFIVLSSAAGILGSRGQGAYAAANTFLDSFVQYRASKGLPGISLDLTAVTGAGYLAQNAERQDDIVRNFGNETVNEEEVLALLTAAVRGDCGVQCLTGMKLHLGSDGQWPYYASDPRFSYLKAECLAEAEKAGVVAKQGESPGNAFRAAKTDEEAANIAGQGILEKLSEVLTISVQDLDVARNITSYGLDSLTAIELRNWIAKELRANLQILELLSSGTINDLAALIVQKTRVL